MTEKYGTHRRRNGNTGSFSTYADKAIGRWAGYTIGWLYWWFWVLVIPLEANIAAMILHSWVPGIPIWLFSLVITLALDRFGMPGDQ